MDLPLDLKLHTCTNSEFSFSDGAGPGHEKEDVLKWTLEDYSYRDAKQVNEGDVL